MDEKKCFFDFGQFRIIKANKVEIIARNGDRELNLGDVIGGRRLDKIILHGRSVDTLPARMTATITLNGVPLLTIAGPYDTDDF